MSSNVTEIKTSTRKRGRNERSTPDQQHRNDHYIERRMSTLIPFQFDGREIRVVADDAGEPQFVGKDICDALAYANAADAIAKHCKGVAKRYPLQTAGGMQEMRVLSEPDVLRLIVNCTLPAAQAFERLVFEEILPTIRKTGSYSASASPAQSPLAVAIQALKLAPIAVRAARALGLDRNAAAISANQYVCAITGQNLLKDFGSIHLIAESQETQWFTPTELSGQASLKAAKLNLLLAGAGFQTRRGKIWELTDAGRRFARLFDTGKKHDSGVPVQQIKWAPAVIAAARQASAPPGAAPPQLF
jgi:prophage antirepressor-like protein